MRRLMCPPTYFDIEYEINPWMNTANKVDPELAKTQWDDFVAALKRLGDEVDFIEPDPRCPDMTFAGDGGLVVDNHFVPSNFRVPERRLEAMHYVKWFSEKGYEIAEYDETVFFEGLGDVVFHGKRAVLGHGIRSDIRCLEILKRFVPDLEILCEMRIVDDRFFHLAMALAFLDDDTVLYYPDAFDAESVERLKASVPNAIAASTEDACEYFACNNLVIGRKVLIDNASEGLRAKLAEHGFECVVCPMSEFKKSGGSLRCLVLSFVDTGGASQ
ncbi:N-dimethylarginine dimethylaminohydrolase [Breoghania corrubedonensis]|uniref:N-dimethylarginine dimethylaminohydrolase n=1 Tax=Breoghania corrubedonensis TaxID=665038 RepID=A0A2T5V9U5_9HYPH|nr:arginine deiminase-related protein [Breoghania corrubedonensis]PTW60529.1 N-dimethylarginine dimethylaminohydrolase [Breoghania corrubedonensis]